MSGVRKLILISILGSALGASACGNSSPMPAPSGPATAVSIPQGASTLTTTAYSPNPVTVAVGTTVRWSNNDSVTHTSTADGGAWNSGNVNGGSSFDFKFNSAGTFTYHCTIHPNMVGTVIVQ
jgi:plastocyanin